MVFLKAIMWRIPLQPHISNNNTDTLLLNRPTGTESLNTTHTVPNSARILQHIKTNCDDRPALEEAINNVYELTSTEPIICYLHGAAGFPTKATWLKVIRKGNYQSWPLVNSKSVNLFSWNQKRPKRGTCVANAKANIPPKKKATNQEAAAAQQSTSQPDPIHVPLDKRKYIFIAVYKPRDTIYTDQTGNFPHTSGRGHNYQMLIHENDGNST